MLSDLYHRWLNSAEFRRRALISILALIAFRAGRSFPLPGIPRPTLEALFRPPQPSFWPAHVLPDLAEVSVAALGIWPLLVTMALREFLRQAFALRNGPIAISTIRSATTTGWIMLASVPVAALMATHAVWFAQSPIVQVYQYQFPGGALPMIILLTGGAMLGALVAWLIDRYGLGQGLWLVLAVEGSITLGEFMREVFKQFGYGVYSEADIAILFALLLATIAAAAGVESARRHYPGIADSKPLNPGGPWPLLITVLVVHLVLQLLSYEWALPLWQTFHVPMLLAATPSKVATILFFYWLFGWATQCGKPGWHLRHLVCASLPACLAITVMLVSNLLPTGLKTPFLLGPGNSIVLTILVIHLHAYTMRAAERLRAS